LISAKRSCTLQIDGVFIPCGVDSRK
jgi:hypothetical protein